MNAFYCDVIKINMFILFFLSFQIDARMEKRLQSGENANKKNWNKKCDPFRKI